MSLFQSILTVFLAVGVLRFAPASADKNLDVPEFSSIRSCGPVTIVVRPGDSYSATVVGDAAASEAITGSVNKGEFVYSLTKKELQTTSPFYVDLTMLFLMPSNQ